MILWLSPGVTWQLSVDTVAQGPDLPDSMTLTYPTNRGIYCHPRATFIPHSSGPETPGSLPFGGKQSVTLNGNWLHVFLSLLIMGKEGRSSHLSSNAMTLPFRLNGQGLQGDPVFLLHTRRSCLSHNSVQTHSDSSRSVMCIWPMKGLVSGVRKPIHLIVFWRLRYCCLWNFHPYVPGPVFYSSLCR